MKRLELGSTPNFRGPIFELQDSHNRDSLLDPLNRLLEPPFFTPKSPPKPRFPAFSTLCNGSDLWGQNSPFWPTQGSMTPFALRLEPENIFRKYFCRSGRYLSSKPRITIDYSMITASRTMINTGPNRISINLNQ